MLNARFDDLTTAKQPAVESEFKSSTQNRSAQAALTLP